MSVPHQISPLTCGMRKRLVNNGMMRIIARIRESRATLFVRGRAKISESLSIELQLKCGDLILQIKKGFDLKRDAYRS